MCYMILSFRYLIAPYILNTVTIDVLDNILQLEVFLWGTKWAYFFSSKSTPCLSNMNCIFKRDLVYWYCMTKISLLQLNVGVCIELFREVVTVG